MTARKTKSKCAASDRCHAGTGVWTRLEFDHLAASPSPPLLPLHPHHPPTSRARQMSNSAKMQRPEPPTAGSRAEAQAQIESNKKKIQSMSETIASTEDKLAQIINEYRCAIRALHKSKQELEEEVSLSLAYISPIRTLPHELLRHIFLLNFEDQPCCAWGVAAVCSLWRRLVLGMPRMWSKVCSRYIGSRPLSAFSYPVFTPYPSSPFLCIDSVGHHTIRERGHYQAVVGTVRVDHPPRHRNLPSGSHSLKQGCQEAFPFPHSPYSAAPDRCPVCTHPASPAHYAPSESILDPAFTDVESDRQSPTHPIHPFPGKLIHEHVLEDESPLGAHCVLLSGRANASMGALHFPIR